MSQSAVTVLEIINKILTRLRESTVSANNDTAQSKAILRFINDAKREVEDAFDWTALQNTITITTAAGTHTYDLEQSSAGVYSNQRSRIVDVFNTTNTVRLTPYPFDYVRRQTQLDTDNQQEPFAWATAGVTTTQSLKIRLYPIPDAVYSIDVETIIPEEDKDSDLQYTKVPWYPVYLKALALAIRERGEDDGEEFNEIQKAYEQAMGDAVAYEQNSKWQGHDGDWIVLGDY